ncbi:MAG: hypothetical protein GXO23_01920 [Crenarchaeota archaeon]|nr:hypothetical protein [Thermoproteota archaeon]
MRGIYKTRHYTTSHMAVSYQIPEDIKRMLDAIKARLREFLEMEYVRTGRVREIEKLWLALEFPEYIRYRDTEWNPHSMELTQYEDDIIRFMSTHLRGIIPEEAIANADLAYIIKFSTTSMRIRDILYQALVETIQELEEVKRVLMEEVKSNLKLLDRESKELALALYLDGDIVRDGRLILVNTYLETVFMPTLRIIFRRRDLNEEKLKEAVTELIKYGLLAHASWKFMNMIFNMYIVPPFLTDLWSQLPLHIDIAIPKFRAIEIEQRKHLQSLLEELKRLIDENKREDALKKINELRQLIDKILLT